MILGNIDNKYFIVNSAVFKNNPDLESMFLENKFKGIKYLIKDISKNKYDCILTFERNSFTTLDIIAKYVKNKPILHFFNSKDELQKQMNEFKCAKCNGNIELITDENETYAYCSNCKKRMSNNI